MEDLYINLSIVIEGVKYNWSQVDQEFISFMFRSLKFCILVFYVSALIIMLASTVSFFVGSYLRALKEVREQEASEIIENAFINSAVLGAVVSSDEVNSKWLSGLGNQRFNMATIKVPAE